MKQIIKGSPFTMETAIDCYRIGEIGYLPGFTLDDWSRYSQIPLDIPAVKTNDDILSRLPPDFPKFSNRSPALRFGWEMLFPEIYSHDCPSDFLEGRTGIPINGLVWMGTPDFQRKQIVDLLDQEFHTLKLKIGGLEIEDELSLLEFLIHEANDREKKVTIRLDANGSFTFDNALKNLEKLSKIPIHSIEQPLPPINMPTQPKNLFTHNLNDDHQTDSSLEKYRQIIQQSPIPIAFDEELIGLTSSQGRELLKYLRPQHLVLKPGVHGGFSQCEEWINFANNQGVGWWIASALESNIGLTAIAFWTAAQLKRNHTLTLSGKKQKESLTMGLGTGSLYANNFISPLNLKGDKLFYDSKLKNEMKKDILEKLSIDPLKNT